eukprot:603983-Prymnesium_polylepis.1
MQLGHGPSKVVRPSLGLAPQPVRHLLGVDPREQRRQELVGLVRSIDGHLLYGARREQELDRVPHLADPPGRVAHQALAHSLGQRVLAGGVDRILHQLLQDAVVGKATAERHAVQVEHKQPTQQRYTPLLTLLVQRVPQHKVGVKLLVPVELHPRFAHEACHVGQSHTAIHDGGAPLVLAEHAVGQVRVPQLFQRCRR